jgi:hypothetical protein
MRTPCGRLCRRRFRKSIGRCPRPAG